MVTASPSGDRSADAMDSFQIRLPRWPFLMRLFSREPLVRTTDRIEAVVVALALLVALLALPVAAAIGTAVHESRSRLYAEQAQTRHSVTATVSDVPDSPPSSRTGMITVPVEWWDGDTRHVGSVQAQPAAASGDPVELWVDAAGTKVPAPPPASRAGVEAVTAAVAIWLSAAAGAAIVSVIVQLMCDRIRSSAWQHDLDSLVDGGGHTTSYP